MLKVTVKAAAAFGGWRGRNLRGGTGVSTAGGGASEGGSGSEMMSFDSVSGLSKLTFEALEQMRTDRAAPKIKDILNAQQVSHLFKYYFQEGLGFTIAADGSMEDDISSVTDDELALLAKTETVRLTPSIQRSLKNLFKLVDADHTGAMEEGEFRVLNRAMYLALKCFWDESLPELSEEEFASMASDDWADDCPAGCESMDWPLFGLSLFQLAHTWVQTDHKADVEAYLGFLSHLHEFLCTTDENGEVRMATDEEIHAKTTAKKEKMRKALALIKASLDPVTKQWAMTDELAELLITPAKEEATAL